MEKCQRDWDEALLKLPSWSKNVDQEVRRYIGACRDVARANLHWRYVHMNTTMRFDSYVLADFSHSFKSGRYLNREEGDQVRATRVLSLSC
jgi:hypothetical protein